jgi:predicted ATPase
VSDIVMKLLQKEPAHRYQSATGLAADLAVCLAQLERTQTVTPFALGTGDVLERFDPPQQLYGRVAETKLLLDSFEHAARGGVAAVLVNGTAGAGKTALVQEIYQPITRRRGYFVSGKFDPLERSVPFSALVDAFQELVEQLLTESESAVAEWRAAIQSAVRPHGRLIVDVVPALELILGPQPPVPDADALEAQNRFNAAFQNFVQVFCDTRHPLVLFLDDVQWADPASLSLIRVILSARSTESLMLVMTCRDNETAGLQPFLHALESQPERGVHVAKIELAPLACADVERFVADALRVARGKAASLAAVVHEKTGGNPFFMRQFLEALHTSGLLRFDARSKGSPLQGMLTGTLPSTQTRERRAA